MIKRAVRALKVAEEGWESESSDDSEASSDASEAMSDSADEQDDSDDEEAEESDVDDDQFLEELRKLDPKLAQGYLDDKKKTQEAIEVEVEVEETQTTSSLTCEICSNKKFRREEDHESHIKGKEHQRRLKKQLEATSGETLPKEIKLPPISKADKDGEKLTRSQRIKLKLAKKVEAGETKKMNRKERRKGLKRKAPIEEGQNEDNLEVKTPKETKPQKPTEQKKVIPSNPKSNTNSTKKEPLKSAKENTTAPLKKKNKAKSKGGNKA